MFQIWEKSENTVTKNYSDFTPNPIHELQNYDNWECKSLVLMLFFFNKQFQTTNPIFGDKGQKEGELSDL